MSLDLYFAYIVACALIAVVPGPTVTVIVANSLKHGTRAGLLNVAGTQLGLALMMATLVIGLSSVIAAMGWLFDWVRYAGAAYLAMAVALISDGAYAVLTGRAGGALSRRKVKLVSRLSGGCLIGGGIWLALTRR